MYIPYEIGDEVYFFKQYQFNELQKGKIVSVEITGNDTIFVVEAIMSDALQVRLPIHKIYPMKSIAKEELLKRVVDYANEKIINN